MYYHNLLNIRNTSLFSLCSTLALRHLREAGVLVPGELLFGTHDNLEHLALMVTWTIFTIPVLKGPERSKISGRGNLREGMSLIL